VADLQDLVEAERLERLQEEVAEPREDESAARLLRTPWTEAWDGADSPGPLPMPLQFMLNADAQARIGHYARTERSRARDLVGIPVGQIVGRMNEVRPTREVIHEMISEFVDTVQRLDGLLAAAEKRR